MNHIRFLALSALLYPCSAPAADPQRLSVTFNSKETDPLRNIRNFALSPEIVFDTGGLRLAKSVLVADEMGATDYLQTLTLSDKVWAKKVIALDSIEADSAELLIYHGPKEVRFNGEALKMEKLKSTGWQRAEVPVKLLHSQNEVEMRGPGGVLIEPTKKPARSYRSTDGGKTWNNDDLGSKGNGPGEFLVRLRVGQPALSGWAESPVFDLCADPKSRIARPGQVTIKNLEQLRQQLQAANLRGFARFGNTPQADDSWTKWAAIDVAENPLSKPITMRWGQVRLEFNRTSSALNQISLDYEFRPDDLLAKSDIKVLHAGDTPSAAVLPSSTVFTYQEPSARLKRLRERHQLDKVIAPGKSEFEQLILLRHWVRHQWHTAWQGSSASWMPPWDAIIIFDSMDKPDCLTMCTHYAAVFTQCCAALGWSSRHCILDHHCTAEVYVNQFRKWVMMDAGNSKERPDCNLHFEKDGIPQSALELLQAVRAGTAKDLKVCFTPPALAEQIASLCRPAPAPKKKFDPRPDFVSAAELPKYPVCGLENYRRYAFPARNNYMSSLLPGELYQGWSEYFYDGYCWVGDSPDKPTRSPEYSRHLSPDRPQDIDWGLNWVRVHLARTAKPGELSVHLETRTPNLARLEINNDKGWKPTPASFTWKLAEGKNTLVVRSVNKFERVGNEERVEVEWIGEK